MDRRYDAIALAEDERAYVPFAVVGVLLLLTSIAVVATLESRSEPEIDTDATELYDRTSALTHGTIQEATVDGLQRAAQQPVTRPNTSTPVGAALDNGAASGDEVFTRWTKFLVYQEVRNQVPHAGQSLQDDVTTEVSVPNHTDPNDAIDAVHLQVGGDELSSYGGPGGGDLPHGAVRVTIPDVEIVVREDGQTVARRTEDYTVTVGSSVFELHHRTNEYEDALNTDLGDREGFAAHFGARLYRLGYLRGTAQSEGEPVAEVLSERHLETLANDARYATQRDVFGNDDAYSDRKLTRSYACMVAADHHDVYDDPTGGSANVSAVFPKVDEPDFCGTANATYEDVPGSLAGATAPDYTQLAASDDYLERTDRLELAQTANATLGEVATEGAIDAAIERTYEVDVSVDSDVETTVPAGPQSGSNDRLHSYDAFVNDIERIADPDGTDREKDYYRVHVIYSGWFDRDGHTANVRYDVNLTITGEHGPGQHVDERGVEHDLTDGPSSDPDVLYDTNYRDAPEDALVEALAGVDDAARAEEQLEAHLRQNGDGVLDGDDVVDVATVNGGDVTVQQSPRDPEALRAWLFKDLRQLNANVGDLSVTYERHELHNGTDPIDALYDAVDDEGRWVYANVTGSHYENVPDKTRAEARRAYLDRLRDRLNRTRDAHQRTLEAVDDETRSNAGVGLTNVTAFARDQLSGTPYEPTPGGTNDSPLVNATITADGEPTYATFEPVNHTQVLAVDESAAGFAPAAARQESVYAEPSDHPVPLEPTGTDEVHLRTAGETLRAAKAAEDVQPGALSGVDVDDFNDTVDGELDDVARDAAEEAARPFPNLERRDVRPHLRSEIEGLGPVERQAIVLASDDAAVDRIAANVSDRFQHQNHPDYLYWRGDRHEHRRTAIREGLHEAIDDGAVSATTADETGDVARALRSALDGRLSDLYEERLDQAATYGTSNRTATSTARSWFQSNDTDRDVAPGSVPAGVRTSHLPDWDVVTFNLWSVEVAGEYARFRVASSEARRGTDRTEYRREAAAVDVEFHGTEQVVGHVEPVEYRSRNVLVVGVPPDGLGVGDRTAPVTECTETWDETGELATRTGVGSPC